MKKRLLLPKLFSPEWVTVGLLLFSVVLPATWFQPGHIIFKGDSVMAFDPWRYFMETWSLWAGKINLGTESSISTASAVHQFIQAIPVLLGGTDKASEIFHFTFWFVLPGVTMGLFIRRLSRLLDISPWAIPVSVAFYIFNLYRLAIFGDNNHFVVYATLPLLLYFITGLFEKDSHWFPLSAGFALSTLLAAQAGANPPMYLMLWLPVFLYGGILSMLHYQQWKKTLAFWLSAGIFTFLLNVFWLLPVIHEAFRQSNLAAAGHLDWLNDLSKHTSLPRVVRLIGAWAWFDTWRGEPYVPYAAIYTKKLWWNLAITPLLLSMSILLFKKAWNRYVLCIFAIGCIGLVFAHGTHPPFGTLFHWAATHLPFFWMFRSPWYKFSNHLAFAYAALIGLATGYLFKALQASRWRFTTLLMVPCIIGLPLVIAHPFITGSMWTTKAEVSNLAPDLIPYPTEVRQAADWLNARPGNTGVALLPYQGAAVYRWGYAAPIDPLNYMSRRPVFVRGDRIGYIPGETPGASVAYRVFVDRLYNGDAVAAEATARLLGIEYVVARNDIKYEFYDDHDSPEFLKERLLKLPHIKYERSFTQPGSATGWDIYRLTNINDDNRIFATNWVGEFAGHPLDGLGSILANPPKDASSFPAIFFSRPLKQPNQSEIQAVPSSVSLHDPVPKLVVKRSLNSYTVQGNADKPFLLVLNMSDNPDWQASGQDVTIGKRLIANGYAPAWLIKPNGNFSVTVSYAPQRWLVPMLIVASLTFIVLVLLLLTGKWYTFKTNI